LPQLVLIIFSLFGFAFLSYHILAATKELYYYVRHKQPLYTSKQKEIFYLQEKIKTLTETNAYLELQLQQITETMIKNLQEKS
tara:strand:- start:2 stop:250 length:249 start_codon:yes stop_codon:yes gene_type:complete